jgi:uncharacterized protein YejL (UPF0352 family)
MNSGIIITTVLGALEIHTTKVDLEAMVVHPLATVTIIITTSFEKKQY